MLDSSLFRNIARHFEIRHSLTKWRRFLWPKKGIYVSGLFNFRSRKSKLEYFQRKIQLRCKTVKRLKLRDEVFLCRFLVKYSDTQMASILYLTFLINIVMVSILLYSLKFYTSYKFCINTFNIFTRVKINTKHSCHITVGDRKAYLLLNVRKQETKKYWLVTIITKYTTFFVNIAYMCMLPALLC